MRSFLPFLFALAWLLTGTSGFSQSKIVGGTDVLPGTYPWMCALVDEGNSNTFQAQFCGGSLIAPSWVVTAAHCVEGEQAQDIGIWANITDLDDTSGGVYRRVVAIYRHPGYREDNLGNLVNDIALLLLESPITSVTPIAYRTDQNLPANTRVEAIGWGDTEAFGYPTILQETFLLIRTISSAQRDYGSSLNIRHLAASRSGRDTCQGDSGGPIFTLDNNDIPELVGITSFGIGCADGPAGIYANVGFFSDWLDRFLTEPTDVDPEVSVVKGGTVIASGTTSVSRTLGTHFGRRLKYRKSKTKSFSLANDPGSTPLEVRRILINGRGFRTIEEPAYVFGGESSNIKVRFTAPNRTKANRGTVRIFTNDQDTPIYTFRVLAKSKKERRRRRGGGGGGFGF